MLSIIKSQYPPPSSADNCNSFRGLCQYELFRAADPSSFCHLGEGMCWRPMSIMYSIGTSCISRNMHRQSFIFICNPTMLPKAFLHSIFQAIDGESLFNEFVGKCFYSLFEIICFVTYPGISNYLWCINTVCCSMWNIKILVELQKAEKYRRMDGRTDKVNPVSPPPTSLGRGINRIIYLYISVTQ